MYGSELCCEDEKSLWVQLEQVTRSWGKMWFREVLNFSEESYLYATCRTGCSMRLLWKSAILDGKKIEANSRDLDQVYLCDGLQLL